MDQKTALEAIILPQARSLRPGTNTVALERGNVFQTGRSHDIFILTLADASQMIARVAKPHQMDELERHGVEILKHISSLNTNCCVPKVYWHNLDEQKKPGDFTVVLLELIPGKPLGVWNDSIPQCQQIRFLDSLAGFLVQLWSMPIPRLEVPAVTYSQWLEGMLDRAIRRCITGTGKWGNTRDYLVMRSMIGDYSSDVDSITGYGIAHGDLHANNILVNDKLELTGVVDWDWSFEAPLPAVVQFPWFIADVPGYHTSTTSPKDSFCEHRDYLVQALRAKEMSKTGSDKLTILLASARERQIFQAAINYRDVHKEFVAKDRRFQGASEKDVRGELEAFLVKYLDLRDEREVKLIMASNTEGAQLSGIEK